jgi:Uma2 family endonuclease
MEARRTAKRWTYTEFTRLPMSGSTRYEVIDDELVMTPSPGRAHQRIVGHLFSLLYTFVRTHRLGEVFVSPFDVLFAEGDYVEPDILFVRADRLQIVKDHGVDGPPDLIIEVLSPSTATRDRGIKLERYRLYGVPEYWVVDPDACTIEVWDLAQSASARGVLGIADTLRWTPVSGGPTLEIAMAEVFGTGG